MPRLSTLLALLAPALLLSVLAAPLAGTAQTDQAAIEGRVVDTETGTPIPVVRIEVTDGRGRTLGSASTNGDGQFSFAGLEPGPVRLFAERIGYAPVAREERVVEGETLVVSLRMSPEALTLAPFEVEAGDGSRRPELEAFSDRARRGTAGTQLAREEIEARAAGRITDLLAGVPGLRIVESPAVRGRHRLVSLAWNLPGRAGGGCPIQIFLNGIPAPDPGPLSGAGGLSAADGVPVDHLARPSDLEGIEVYTDLASVPSEYLTPGAGCGVIGLWTRSGLRASADPATKPGVSHHDPSGRSSPPQ